MEINAVIAKIKISMRCRVLPKSRRDVKKTAVPKNKSEAERIVKPGVIDQKAEHPA
jgi:hypothetical protein